MTGYGWIQLLNVLYFVTFVSSAVTASVTMVVVLSWICSGFIMVAAVSLASLEKSVVENNENTNNRQS